MSAIRNGRARFTHDQLAELAELIVNRAAWKAELTQLTVKDIYLATDLPFRAARVTPGEIVGFRRATMKP